MGDYEKCKGELKKGENDKQKCSMCGRWIPKEVERISLSYYGSYGGNNHKRICGLCLSQLYEVLDKKAVENWKLKLITNEL